MSVVIGIDDAYTVNGFTMNQNLRTTDSPTFARVITPRVDNNGGALQLNPAGGDVEIGDPTKGNGIWIKSQDGSVPLVIGNNGLQLRTGYGGAYIRSFNSVGNLSFLDLAVGGAGFQISGYTKLGADAGAPGIKMKELTGTTGGVGTGVVVAHGLDATKILSIKVTLQGGAIVMDMSHALLDGNWMYGYYCDATNLNVGVGPGGILAASRAFRALITYKE